MLTGDGGDETFGGYGRYRFQGVMQLGDHVPLVIRQGLDGYGPRGPVEDGPTLAPAARLDNWRFLVEMGPDERYVRLMEIFGPELRESLLGDEAAGRDGYLADVLSAGPSDPLDRMLWADTLTYLPEDLLVKVDRATMANSLEARAPLLDHKVIEFAARLPSNRKISRGVTKLVLRDVAKSLMPARLVDRPKRGFGVPIAAWFRSDLAGVYRDTVLAPDACLRDHLDQDVAAAMLAEHLGGRADLSRRMWLLLAFELLGAAVAG